MFDLTRPRSLLIMCGATATICLAAGVVARGMAETVGVNDAEDCESMGGTLDGTEYYYTWACGVDLESVYQIHQYGCSVPKAMPGDGPTLPDKFGDPAVAIKEDKNLNEEVGVEAIRGYVAYTESIPNEKRLEIDNTISKYALGSTDTALCIFYYERDRVTTLDIDFLGDLKIKNLPFRPEQFVIYADKCALDKDFLYKHGITFKRIPRDITRF